MADLDSGHIFLTTFAPIKSDAGADTTHKLSLRDALARLHTALQSPATQKAGANSPFARNTRNHLARMFVLDDVIYNGRIGQNALSASLLGNDPIDPQDVDRLNASYLVFCADIDAVTEDGARLPANLSAEQQREVRASYARVLWRTMEAELRDIYGNCVGFEQVRSEDDFAAYLDRCHVETTMPFHDYYLDLPEFHHLPLKGLAAAVLVPLVVALVALFLRIIGVLSLPFVGWSTFWVFLLGLCVTAICAFLAIRFAIKNGEKPLAPGKYDDLPTVLKALYAQQKFSDFVIEHQGASAEILHRDFGAFLETHRPSDRSGPTQAPGVIRTPAGSGVTP